jgi:membrane-associated phospholipid phosphatase
VKEILYDWGGLNVWLFHAINNLRGDAWDYAMQLGTALGDHARFPLYMALLGLAALWYLATARAATTASDRAPILLAVLATLSLAYFVDGLVVNWLKVALDFPRPPLALPPDSLHVLGPPEYHHSLPSGHATFAMTLAAGLWPLFRRPGRIGLAAFVLWVCLSRISLGAHFPADVLAGCLVGLAVVTAIRATAEIAARRPRNA